MTSRTSHGNNRFLARVDPTSSGPAPGGDALLAVPNIAALQALDDTTIDDGGVVSVLSVRDLWMLDRTSVLAVDGITVVLPLSGTGRWLRMKLPSEKWLQQTTWYINQTIGNDENVGNVVGVPLKTHSEFTRRVGKGPIVASSVDIYFTDTVPHIEDIIIEYTQLGDFPSVTYHGTRTILYSGSATGVVPYNPAARVSGSITDAALPVSWSGSGLVNRMLVLTSGANAGAVGWIAKDEGAKTARYSPLFNIAGFTTVDPALGDTFDVVRLTAVDGTLRVNSEATVFFFDFDFANRTIFAPSVLANKGFLSFFYCAFDSRTQYYKMVAQAFACRFGAAEAPFTIDLYVSECVFYDSLFTGKLRIQESSFIRTRDSISQSSAGSDVSIDVEENCKYELESARHHGLFDMTASVQRGLHVRTSATAELTGLLWGTGNTFDYAIDVESGGQVIYTTLPDVQAAAIRDTLIAGFARNYVALPATNLSKLAGIVQS
jgi:hypothetical protein